MDFFIRRNNALSLLLKYNNSKTTILPGAEIYYYHGISSIDELESFVIGSTNLLLLEMPFCDWTDSIIKDVLSIQRDRNIDVVLAHIDRYYTRYNKTYIDSMLDVGILSQVNASAFLNKRQQTDVLRLLKRKEVHFIASDCHNMTSRPPHINEAFAVIEKNSVMNTLNILVILKKIFCLGCDA